MPQKNCGKYFAEHWGSEMMDMTALSEEIFPKESVLKIDLAAIKNNIRVLKEKTNALIIGVVKENGYGLGLQTEYEILKRNGITYFATTSADEALALRRYGATEPILLLAPFYEAETAEALCAQDITQMLGHLSQLAVYKQVKENLNIKPKVHLAIDTGMGRYGFLWNNLPKECASFAETVEITGTYSHFNNNEKMAPLQLKRFQQALEDLRKLGINPGLTHMSNSAATMTIGDGGLDAVRIGSAFLGKCARGGQALRTAVWLEAEICQVSYYPKGATIGYMGSFKLKRDSRLGLVKVGHNDGVAIGTTDGTSKLWHGILHQVALKFLPKRYQKYAKIGTANLPVIGRSGVSHTLLDLTDSDVQAGDTVRLNVNPLYVPISVPKEIIKGNE